MATQPDPVTPAAAAKAKAAFEEWRRAFFMTQPIPGAPSGVPPMMGWPYPGAFGTGASGGPATPPAGMLPPFFGPQPPLAPPQLASAEPSLFDSIGKFLRLSIGLVNSGLEGIAGLVAEGGHGGCGCGCSREEPECGCGGCDCRLSCDCGCGCPSVHNCP
jgi:hypothetical protein